jgi:leucine dehydrogenase
MGIEPRDVAVMARLTRHVSHTPRDAVLDTAALAALGVVESIRAAALRLDLRMAGLRVAVQGAGQVGARVARQLHAAGARLVVADVDEGRAERLHAELGAEVVAPDAVYDVDCDVFSPNAGGGVIADATIPRLRCRAVVGGANEQLAEDRHGDALHARGILYGPDYVVNAGGLLSLLFEVGEADEEGVTERVRAIGKSVAELWGRAEREGLPPHRLADRVAEERLAAARAARAGRREDA